VAAAPAVVVTNGAFGLVSPRPGDLDDMFATVLRMPSPLAHILAEGPIERQQPRRPGRDGDLILPSGRCRVLHCARVASLSLERLGRADRSQPYDCSSTGKRSFPSPSCAHIGLAQT
jgi:hypothetical protein